MSKKIETSESSYQKSTIAGTFFGALFMSNTLSNAIDSATSGGETKEYHLIVDGQKTTFDNEQDRDNAARNAI